MTSETLSIAVKARSMRNFCDKSLSVKLLFVPLDSIKDNTAPTSHMLEYLGRGGLKLYAPFNSGTTKGCSPTCTKSM